MGFGTGLSTGLEQGSRINLNYQNAKNQELQNKILQQHLDGTNALRELFKAKDPQYETNSNAIETAPSNLHDIIGQAAVGRAGPGYDPYASVAPQVRGAYQQAPQGPLDILGGHEMSKRSLFDGGGMKWRDTSPDALNSRVDQLPIPDMRGGARHEPAPFGAYQPAPQVNRMERPSVELAGPGEAIDNLNGNAIPREALRDGGPGLLAEGPRPMSEPSHENIPGAPYKPADIIPPGALMREVPGSRGLGGNLSPEFRAVFENVMRANGGDYEKAAALVNLLSGGQSLLPTTASMLKLSAGERAYPLGAGTGLPTGAPPLEGQPRYPFGMPNQSLLGVNGDTGEQVLIDRVNGTSRTVSAPGQPGTNLQAKPLSTDTAGGAAGFDDVALYSKLYPDRTYQIKSMLGPNKALTMNALQKYATPEELAGVNKAKVDQQVERARAVGSNTAQIRIDEERKSPAYTNTGVKWMKMNAEGNLAEPLLDTSRAQDEIAQEGYQPLLPKQFEDAANANQVQVSLLPRMKHLKALSDELIRAVPGGLSAIKQGIAYTIKGKLLNDKQPTKILDPETGVPMTVGEVVKLYSQILETTGEQFSRQVNGLKGAATEGDVKRAMAAFPSLFNTQAVAAGMWSQTIENVENAREGMHDSLFGVQRKYDLAQYSPETRGKIERLMAVQGWDAHRALKHLHSVGQRVTQREKVQGGQ